MGVPFVDRSTLKEIKMGFNYAGTLGGAGAPVVRRFQTGEDCYVGQLVGSGMLGGAGGHVQILDAAGEAFEDDVAVIGMISAIADKSRSYVAAVSGTANYGDKSVYTATH